MQGGGVEAVGGDAHIALAPRGEAVDAQQHLVETHAENRTRRATGAAGRPLDIEAPALRLVCGA
ncbi:hypothetical protein GCM10023351_15050 [Microbacterium gilvum]|uniref:Uncharacterized protein n=1 Tax=Microbacterium gilvum TaxID=1336204 RepID=A0ABP9A156_9MICO